MEKAEILSLNVGKPKEKDFGKKSVTTGFFKKPIQQAVFLSSVNFTGDGQGDLVHHGGVHKAVCVYPFAHYAHWEKTLGRTLSYGAFGENLTITGLTEENVCIGDSFQLGEAIVQVSQPRQPCFKLGLVYERKDMPLLVQNTGYTGFYFRVLQEGMVSSTDMLFPLTRHVHGITVAEANRLMHHDKQDLDAIRRLLEVEELSPSWRKTFEKRAGGQEVDTSERISGEK
ncbi:MOSC domain-containing protein [Sporosarcina sp. P33]|uniref:MOSC domain-containing protein n=1 Tax=Sporosarcina sp. P33 TaxID=1930764 RepID=UPI0009BFC4DC|nr:MOSC domain-containing protein [Sporosarcina sp. P33]ARD46883.1 cytoplasmic protein [Sporosarcina sp. P33]